MPPPRPRPAASALVAYVGDVTLVPMTPDLEDWRRALLERRAALLRERMSIAADERELLEDEAGERPTQQTLAQVLDTLGARELAHLQDIADAILRLDAGRFGRCVDCGEAIATERLRASPEAARCTSCAGRHERARRFGRRAV